MGITRGESRTICLFNSQTAITASGVGSDMVIPMSYTAAIISLAGGNISGTSPSITVFVQNKLRQSASTDLAGNDVTGTAIYDDFMAFTAITASTSVQVARVGPATNNVVHAQQDAAISAATVVNGPIGSAWRVKYTVSGTSPSLATLVVQVELIP